MEREYGYLLNLLGAFITGKIPEKCPEADWKKLCDLAAIHQVTGILGYMDMNYRLCPDTQISADLRQKTLATMLRYARLGSLCSDLSQKLTDANIDHVLMKGAVLREYYPVPELRTFGDVDFVIRPEDREKSHQLMLSLGFHPKVDWGPIYGYSRGAEFCELHTQIMEVDVNRKVDYRGYFDRMWEFVTPGEKIALEFTPEFHFIYLLTHIAKHIRGSGAGVRMYLDLAAFMLHFEDRIDWDWIRRELEELELFAFAAVALTSVELWFGVRCPMVLPEVPEERLVRFRAFTLEAGVYGRYEREQGSSVLQRAESLDSGSRLGLVAKRLFPPAEELEARYTYLQRKPWLLPAAWVHRLVITREKLEQHTREAKTILNADAQEVNRLQSIHRELGID